MADINLDIDLGEIKLKPNNDLDLVEYKKELENWIYKVLMVQRNRHKIYTNSYGIGTDELIGLRYEQEYINAEVKRDIIEALTVNEEVLEVKDFTFEFKGSKLSVTFTVDTVYGTEGFSYDI